MIRERYLSKAGKSRQRFVLVSALVLAICSCAKESEAPKRDHTAEKVVETAKAELQPMERTIGVAGSFYAHEQATLSAKIPGRLQKISVDIGSVVMQGDLLAQIDPSDYQIRLIQADAALSQARARLGLPLDGDNDKIDSKKTGIVLQAQALLDEATKNRNRIQNLARENIASESELETAESAYLVAVSRYQNALEEIRERQALVAQRRAELNIAQKQLADTTIQSPFDGIVQQRSAGLGEFLATGTPLLVVAQVDPLRLRLEIPERESLAVRAGQPLRITVGNNTNAYSAKISRVSPMLSRTNRMLVAEADVPATPALRPGLFVRANIVVTENDLALCVPEEAVTSFVGLEKVFTVEDGKAQENSVRTGRRQNGFVEIVSGISAGDTVILNPENMRSGQAVIEEANAKAR